MAMAEDGRYRLAIQEGPNGRPVMVLEPIGEAIPDQSDQILAVELRDGITHAEVLEWLARFNEQVAGSPLSGAAPAHPSASRSDKAG